MRFLFETTLIVLVVRYHNTVAYLGTTTLYRNERKEQNLRNFKPISV